MCLRDPCSITCWLSGIYKTVCLLYDILFYNLLICSLLHGPTGLVTGGSVCIACLDYQSLLSARWSVFPICFATWLFFWCMVSLPGWVCTIAWNTVCYKTVCPLNYILFRNVLICSVLHEPTGRKAGGLRMYADYSVRHIGFAAVWLVWCPIVDSMVSALDFD